MHFAVVSIAICALSPGASAFLFRMPWIPLPIPIRTGGGSVAPSTPCAINQNDPNFANCAALGGMFPAFSSTGAFQGCF